MHLRKLDVFHLLLLDLEDGIDNEKHWKSLSIASAVISVSAANGLHWRRRMVMRRTNSHPKESRPNQSAQRGSGRTAVQRKEETQNKQNKNEKSGELIKARKQI